MAAKPYFLIFSALALAAASPASAVAPDQPEWTALPEVDPNFVVPPEAEVTPRRPARRRAPPINLSAEEAEAYEAGLRAGQAAKETEDALARAERAICKSWKDAERTGGEVPAWAAHCR